MCQGASVPALKSLEIRFMQGLFARCTRVLQYQLKSSLKAGLCKACLPDASGCISISFEAA